MNQYGPTRTRHLGEEGNWPRHKPLFTLTVFFCAFLAAAITFAYQFKTKLHPLERLYFTTYFRTAHLSSPRNRYLRPVHTWPLLMVVYPGAIHLATNDDVQPVTTGVGTSGLALTPSALRDAARGLLWKSQRIDDEQLHKWLAETVYGGNSIWRLFRDAWYSSLLFLAFSLPFAVREDMRDARKRLEGRPLKGANLVSRTEYHRRTRHHSGIGWDTTNEASLWERAFLLSRERTRVRIARQNEPEHFLFVGDTGTGKSSLIRQLLVQIQDREETGIVYDPALEYLPQFFNPKRGDVVLNPLDARMPYWSPSDELAQPTEAETIAKSLFPDRDRENRFFIESPRKIFAHLLKYHPTPQQLCDWIAHADPEIDRRVAGTPLEAIVSNDAPQQRAGVMAVLERAASAFALLPAQSKDRSPWSVTRWVENREGWIFVTSTPETREILRPLVSLWLDFLTLRLSAQAARKEVLKPVWVVMDELASLETLPTLPLALAESRKSNTRIVLGLQGRSQVELRYGREAEAMLSQPRTKILLRTSEPRAAEWISKSIGDVEVEHLREGRSTGDFGLRYSKNATVDRRIEAALLASEIANLDNLEGYFLTPGYVLKLTFPYFSPHARQPGLEPTGVSNVPLRLPDAKGKAKKSPLSPLDRPTQTISVNEP